MSQQPEHLFTCIYINLNVSETKLQHWGEQDCFCAFAHVSQHNRCDTWGWTCVGDFNCQPSIKKVLSKKKTGGPTTTRNPPTYSHKCAQENWADEPNSMQDLLAKDARRHSTKDFIPPGVHPQRYRSQKVLMKFILKAFFCQTSAMWPYARFICGIRPNMKKEDFTWRFFFLLEAFLVISKITFNIPFPF